TEVNFQEILRNVEDRDAMDSTREISPLKIADDALILDNSHLTREEQLLWSLDRFNERTGNNES
ncbi:MAG: (d)CMP kinase, partial [Mariniphaga sp.]|nr:(d)CMP kinase [Mariniphaga sp.]